MKLIAYHKCLCTVLILFCYCYVACSNSIPYEGASFLCKELYVANSRTGPLDTIGLLHSENETLSLQLSWNFSGFQASIVSVDFGWALWRSKLFKGSNFMVICLDGNGNFVLRSCSDSSVFWESLAHGVRVRDFQFLEKEKLPQAGDVGCAHSRQKWKRSRIMNSISRRRLLQDSDPVAGTAVEADASPDRADGDGGGHRSKKALAMEIVFPVVGFLLLLPLCRALAMLRRRGKSKLAAEKPGGGRSTLSKQSIARQEEDEILIGSLAPVGLPPRFAYADMHKATDGFAKKLGEGGYGAVFEGKLEEPGSPRIAVKVFRNTATLACRNGFCKEVLSIGQRKHPNLVPLLGFCVEDEHRMLVYELMENGSLNRLLFGESPACGLLWERRVAIAADTARALAFLHEEGEHKRAVIHCDLKPENILLDENWVAKVSDFGLAKLLWVSPSSVQKHHDEDDDGDDHDGSSFVSDGRHAPSELNVSSSSPGSLSSLVSSKGIRGTLGYLAPEWIRMDVGPGSITAASDVYSFGVVLLELIAGRRSMVPGLPFLLGQAFDMLASGDDLANLLDAHLLKGLPLPTSTKVLEEARNLAKIGLWCLQEDPALRPTMATIVNMITNKELVATPPFCDYFAGSSHFFDEIEYPVRDSLLGSNKGFETSIPTSYHQGSWQISILSGR